MRKHSLKNAALTFALVGAVGIGACSDDPVGIDDDHADDVEGIELVLNGMVIASYDGDTGTWTGELEVDEGEETAHITVRLVDHDGDAITPDSDLYLEVDITHGDVAMWEQDTPGEFGGHLHGLAEGDTEAVFKVMHGAVGSGHADFQTAPVHVHVHAHGG